MRKYVVRQGECIASIAARHGLTPDALWEQNAELASVRDSGFILRPGDIVEVPEPEGHGNRAPFSSGGTKRFQARVPVTTLKLRIVADDGSPLASARYEITSGALEREGQTDGDGKLEVSVPATLAEAELRVWFPEEDDPRLYPLALGHLDPVDEASGLRQRLANLGYAVAHATDPDALAHALRLFQEREELEVSGVADDATRTRLVERHGC